MELIEVLESSGKLSNTAKRVLGMRIVLHNSHSRDKENKWTEFESLALRLIISEMKEGGLLHAVAKRD